MMLYAKFEDSEGSYADSACRRYDVCVVRRVRSPQGLNVGYVPFPSLEDALEYWGLVPVVPAISNELEPARAILSVARGVPVSA